MKLLITILLLAHLSLAKTPLPSGLAKEDPNLLESNRQRGAVAYPIPGRAPSQASPIKTATKADGELSHFETLLRNFPMGKTQKPKPSQPGQGN